MAIDYLEKILNAQVYDVAIESPLAKEEFEPVPYVSPYCRD